MLLCLSAVVLICSASAVLYSDPALHRKLKASTGSALNHSFTLGKRRLSDRMFYLQNATKPARWMWLTTSVDVELPPSHQAAKGILHYIEVRDNTNKGKGGYAYLVKGGIYSSYAKFHIKSQPGYGLNFTIGAWGY